ncbi:MAG: S1C family serine protease [Muribaculaceae bacterium]
MGKCFGKESVFNEYGTKLNDKYYYADEVVEAVYYFRNGYSLSKYDRDDMLVVNCLDSVVYKQFEPIKHIESWEQSNIENTYFDVDNNCGVLYANSKGVVANFYSHKVNPENLMEMLITVDSVVEADNFCGLCFGMKDLNNYTMLFLKSGYYSLWHVVNGKNLLDDSWIKSDVDIDMSQNNTICVLKYDDKLDISINGQELALYSNFYFQGDMFGFKYFNNTENLSYMSFSNIEINEYLRDKEEVTPYLPYKLYCDTASLFAIIDKTVSFVKGSNPWKSSGSGFFITIDGYIATNNHVIENSKEIEVSFFEDNSWKNYEAVVVAVDKTSDLAILKINDDNFKPFELLPYSFDFNVKPTGADVFTLGFPMSDVLGTEVKFASGKVSSKTGVQGDIMMYQITVPVQPGNSGGPLFDYNGNIIGITSASLDKEQFNSENVNYAVKSLYLKSLIDVALDNVSLSAPKKSTTTLTNKIEKYRPFMTLIKCR